MFYVGISGWNYAPWRGGVFYPKKMPQYQELSFASRTLTAIEINGTFYRLQKPENFQRWYDETPKGFTFAIKGNRFITHVRRGKDVDEPLANFFASGLLCLKEKLGPCLWQFPPSLHLKDDRFEAFVKKLPRDHQEAGELAKKHTEKVAGHAFTEDLVNEPIRHAFEFRHKSFNHPDFIAMMRAHGCAIVVPDAGEHAPGILEVTSDFVYVRMHGQGEGYEEGYPATELTAWANIAKKLLEGKLPEGWSGAKEMSGLSPTAVYFFFDNDQKGFAPHDAGVLMKNLGIKSLEAFKTTCG